MELAEAPVNGSRSNIMDDKSVKKEKKKAKKKKTVAENPVNGSRSNIADGKSVKKPKKKGKTKNETKNQLYRGAGGNLAEGMNILSTNYLNKIIDLIINKGSKSVKEVADMSPEERLDYLENLSGGFVPSDYEPKWTSDLASGDDEGLSEGLGALIGAATKGITAFLKTKAGRELTAAATDALVGMGKDEIDKIRKMPREEKLEKIGKISKNVKDKVQSIGGDISDIAGNVGTKASDIAGGVGDKISNIAGDIGDKLPWRNKEEESIEESTTISKKNILESIDDYYEEDYDHVDTVYEDDSRTWFATENEEPTIEEDTIEEDCGCGDTVAEEELSERGNKAKRKEIKPKSPGDPLQAIIISLEGEESPIEEANPVFTDALSGDFHRELDVYDDTYGGPQTAPSEEPGTAPVEAPPETDKPTPRINPKKAPFINPGKQEKRAPKAEIYT